MSCEFVTWLAALIWGLGKNVSAAHFIGCLIVNSLCSVCILMFDPQEKEMCIVCVLVNAHERVIWFKITWKIRAHKRNVWWREGAVPAFVLIAPVLVDLVNCICTENVTPNPQSKKKSLCSQELTFPFF